MLSKRLRRAHPTEFTGLHPAELALTGCRNADHLRLLLRTGPACRDEAIAFTNEKIADVESHGDSEFLVESFFAVTLRVVVFDVIVNQRGFVEALHGDGNLPQVIRQWFADFIPQGLECCHSQKRPPTFAGPHKPRPG